MNRLDYGKITDSGSIEYPPREFVENDVRTCGFTEEYLMKRGYSRIIQSGYPLDDNIYTPVYTQTGENEITLSWKLESQPQN